MVNKLIHGDSLHVLKSDLEDSSVDVIITDPPYGYSFMNKDWDKAVVSVETWKECLRVLKPGAFAAIMSSPRQDILSRMIVNLQDAGFRTDFTSIYWTYASGFPKAMNIGKRLNEFEGAFAGFQPKPAVEVILMVMKPLSEKSYVDQALSNGKGVTWLDDVRIPYQDNKDIYFGHHNKEDDSQLGKNSMFQMGGINRGFNTDIQGRFPANLLVSDDVLNDGQQRKSGKFEDHHIIDSPKTQGIYGDFNYGSSKISYGDVGSYSRFFDLDKWFDTTFPFLAVPKASSSEKNKGCELLPMKQSGGMNGTHDKTLKTGSGNERNNFAKNFHPTVKPLKLMSWLVSLLTRPMDLILDPFCGSGTTCLAAKMLKRKWIGIEANEEYLQIAEHRIKSFS